MTAEQVLNSIRGGGSVNPQGIVLIEEKTPTGTQKVLRFIMGVVPRISPVNETGLNLELAWPDGYDGVPDCGSEVSQIVKIARPSEDYLRNAFGNLIDRMPKHCAFHSPNDFTAHWFYELKEFLGDKDVEKKLFAILSQEA